MVSWERRTVAWVLLAGAVMVYFVVGVGGAIWGLFHDEWLLLLALPIHVLLCFYIGIGALTRAGRPGEVERPGRAPSL